MTTTMSPTITTAPSTTTAKSEVAEDPAAAPVRTMEDDMSDMRVPETAYAWSLAAMKAVLPPGAASATASSEGEGGPGGPGGPATTEAPPIVIEVSTLPGERADPLDPPKVHNRLSPLLQHSS